jgi:hypothetical protein
MLHVESRSSATSPKAAAGATSAAPRGRRTAPPLPANPQRHPKLGTAFVHTVLDDHSRVADAEVRHDETAATATAVLRRAVTWFTDRGITTIERVLSDNGSANSSAPPNKPAATPYPPGSTTTTTTDPHRHQQTTTHHPPNQPPRAGQLAQGASLVAPIGGRPDTKWVRVVHSEPERERALGAPSVVLRGARNSNTVVLPIDTIAVRSLNSRAMIC